MEQLETSRNCFSRVALILINTAFFLVHVWNVAVFTKTYKKGVHGLHYAEQLFAKYRKSRDRVHASVHCTRECVLYIVHCTALLPHYLSLSLSTLYNYHCVLMLILIFR